MPDHVYGRKIILEKLREELVGPSPQGKEIDCTVPILFDDVQLSYGPWYQKDTGEEILLRNNPCKRYGVGVLYPIGTTTDPVSQDQTVEALTSNFEALGDDNNPITPKAQEALEAIENRAGKNLGEVDSTEFDISLANTFKPSSMGVTFLVDLSDEAKMVVEVSGGRYRQRKILVQARERTWWLRSPVSLKVQFSDEKLITEKEAKVIGEVISEKNLDDLEVKIEVFSRPYKSARQRLVTVCLINHKQINTQPDRYCLFQAFFRVAITSPHGKRYILPYPEAFSELEAENGQTTLLDTEELSLALLYRKAQTFAVGHGCAANWESRRGTWQDQLVTKYEATDEVPMAGDDAIGWVSAESLPSIEIPSITPDIKRDDGTKVEVAMAPLAGLVPGDNGFTGLEEVISLYEIWIERRIKEIPALAPRYWATAQKHMDQCKNCVQRMRKGLQYLRENSTALRAFQLANHAMLFQQVRTSREPRKVQYDAKSEKFIFSAEYPNPNLLNASGGKGKWRAFQIAFILMSIQSTADHTDSDREIVELIWFPTGGGKTEAYFGLAAFAMFMRRLEDADNVGVQVLMRYTLRLLTAQQFQRASGLLCAMEYLRRSNATELGKKEFSIGIWLGGSTTPNQRTEALDILKRLERNDRFTENKFILSKCPWCQAQLGPIKNSQSKTKTSQKGPHVIGYEQQGGTVVFKCPDRNCAFSSGLPIYVIDEDIYDKRPSMLIGTVDKFALLAWKPQVRQIFGIDQNGIRQFSPPNLIIQDELHLISGPLGSMVGLYETIIEELCTDRRYDRLVFPKIISSTATIRRYVDQIKKLYARDKVALFPPPGLSADDSFFACYATSQDGKLENGRIYVGIHAPGLGSLQTAQVRTFSSLLQAPLSLSQEERDPWWTLLLFFNSLRELGTTLSLFQSDIPDYFQVLKNRMGFDYSELRRLWNILELTGRLRSDEVPEAISKLEAVYGKEKYPVDVCLASNIIEVGVDIDRLSLMAVVGQPKTTSQYIQVTGRVGRRWFERPGLVVTIYGASKPRDRSHFEKFRSYHERLYAQVEPTSVTPFAPPVLDRALHAIMVAYVLQIGDRESARRPYPYPQHLIEQIQKIMFSRVNVVDIEEAANLERVFKKRAKEWRQWQRNVWEDSSGNNLPLLRYAGAHVDPDQENLSWPTPSSMRDVDAQCEAIITSLYANSELGDDENE